MNGAEVFPQETPPPKGAKLLEMMQLSMNGVEKSAIRMPPPLREASLLVMVQLVMVGEVEDATEMPPPAEALLLVMMQLVIVGVALLPTVMPPPKPEALLLVMMQFLMVGEASVPIRTPPPFPDVEPSLIVNPSRVASKPSAMVTTLPLSPPSILGADILVDSGPFSEIRVTFVLLLLPGANRIFS